MPERDEVLVLDASAVINLLGSGAGSEILAALPYQSVIADRVQREMLYHPIKGLDVADAIDDWVAAGHLSRLALSEGMLAHYLEIAGLPPPHHLDDGEAASIAVAEAMQATVVIDERRGRRVVEELFPALRLQSSAGLFQVVAESRGMDKTRLAEALFLALDRSRMRVVPEGLIDWVIATIGKGRAAQCRSLPKRFR